MAEEIKEETNNTPCYCKDAKRLTGKVTVCGNDCPIFNRCPRLTIEDAVDVAIDKAMEEMIKVVKSEKRKSEKR